VTLGLGSVIASAASAAPWLVPIGRHKEAVFGVTGILMALNYWLLVVRPRRCAPGDVCHVDSRLMRLNRRIYWVSAAVYLVALASTCGSVLVLEEL
jgi:hypothetical protein